MSHLFSVAVVLRNESKNLGDLLSSFESELFDASDKTPDILFVDNASTDTSLGLLKDWRDQHKNVSIKIIERSKNNLGEARQDCLDQCQTPWLCFIDADTTLDEGWFKAIAEAMTSAPEHVVGLGGKADYSVSDPWQEPLLKYTKMFPLRSAANTAQPVFHVPTNNYLIRVKPAQACGGFDSFFDRVGEDLDFNVRFRKQGKILYDPSFSVTHKFPALLPRWIAKMGLYGRAQSFVVLKNRGGVPPIKFLPLSLALTIVLIAFKAPILFFLLTFVLFAISRLRLPFISLFFYGLGELVGLVLYAPKRLLGR